MLDRMLTLLKDKYEEKEKEEEAWNEKYHP